LLKFVVYLFCIMVCRIVVFLPLATLALVAQGDNPAAQKKRMSTQKRLQQPGWWPRNAAPARSEYTGPAVCAQCHSDIARTQRDSAMARTSSTAGKSFVFSDKAIYQRSPCLDVNLARGAVLMVFGAIVRILGRRLSTIRPVVRFSAGGVDRAEGKR
jgi:hypothetical protein